MAGKLTTGQPVQRPGCSTHTYETAFTREHSARFRKIRNTLTAHWGEDEKQGELTPDDIAEAWKLVHEEGLNAILRAIPPLFSALHRVSMLYHWTKTTPDGALAIIQPFEYYAIADEAQPAGGCALSVQALGATGPPAQDDSEHASIPTTPSDPEDDCPPS